MGFFGAVHSSGSKVTDIWSYWRFHVKKGYFTSLLENLQDFYPRNIFDEQKKIILKAHIYNNLNKSEFSNELFEIYGSKFPLLADYSQYRIVLNLFQKDLTEEKRLIDIGTRFIEDYPQSAFLTRVQHMLVQTFYKQSECQASLNTLESYEESNQKLTSAQNRLDQWVKGNCLVRLNKKDKGIEVLKELWEITSDPKLVLDIESLLKKLNITYKKEEVLRRARFLKRLARHDKALELITTLISRVDCHTDCLKLEASLFFSNKQYDKSVKAYQFLYGMLKESRYLYLSCRSHARAGNTQGALSCYAEFDRQKKISPFLRMAAYYFRAQLLADEERWAEASSFFERVISYKRNNLLVQRAYWTLGWINLHSGNYEKAIPYFKSLMKRGPDGVEKGQGTYWLAKTYLKLGRKQEATQLYDKLRRDSPLSYYGVLSQNRVNELTHKIDLDSLPPFSSPERKPPMQIDLNEKELFSGSSLIQERLYLLQIKELAAIGLMEDARYLLNLLLKERKFSPRILAQLYLEVQDYYQAIQLAYSQLGYDQTRFPKTNKEWFYWNILYPQAYAAWVEPLADKYSFNPYVLWAIMRSESLFRETIVSNAGAKGLLQIMPYTGKKLAEKLKLSAFDLDQLVIPEVNILLSSKYIHDLIFKMDGHLIFTIGAYNAGPHKVTRWMNQFQTSELDEFIERVPYVETRKYLMKNIHFLAVYTYLYHPNDSRFRVANVVHKTPNPLLNPDKENWDYEIH